MPHPNQLPPRTEKFKRAPKRRFARRASNAQHFPQRLILAQLLAGDRSARAAEQPADRRTSDVHPRKLPAPRGKVFFQSIPQTGSHGQPISQRQTAERRDLLIGKVHLDRTGRSVIDFNRITLERYFLASHDLGVPFAIFSVLFVVC